MKELAGFSECCWFTGSGQHVDAEFLTAKIFNKLKDGSKLFIGTDSFIEKNKVTFASALCVYGPGQNSFYFFTKHRVNKRKYLNLATRITEEVSRTITLADYFQKTGIPNDLIEVHIDVSPFENKKATSRFSEGLRGYVMGAGYACKLKPNAWASQSVADRHSK